MSLFLLRSFCWHHWNLFEAWLGQRQQGREAESQSRCMWNEVKRLTGEKNHNFVEKICFFLLHPILSYHLMIPLINPATPCGGPNPQVWNHCINLSYCWVIKDTFLCLCWEMLRRSLKEIVSNRMRTWWLNSSCVQRQCQRRVVRWSYLLQAFWSIRTKMFSNEASAQRDGAFDRNANPSLHMVYL